MKFEENIKQKLDGREITPSDAAWERISKSLDTEKPKNRKPKWGWIAVAAGFVGALILATNFFGPNLNNNNNRNKNNQIVTVPAKKDPIVKETIPEERLVQDNMVLEQVNKNEPFGEKTPETGAKVGAKEGNVNFKENFIEKDNAFLPHRQAGAVAEKTIQKPLKSSKNPSKITEKFEDPELNRSIDQEVNALLATVDSLQKKNQKVSEADVDALLAQAQQKLLVEREFSNETENLSATALLREAEGELDRSFRDRIFNALKEGYIKTREALASRND